MRCPHCQTEPPRDPFVCTHCGERLLTYLGEPLGPGTGLRAAFGGITMSIPIVGTWMHWLIFDGDFPGDLIIPRLYVAHVLLFPGIILALIAGHLALVWYQKHTQFPGPGRTEQNVVGVRILPVFAMKGGAFFAMTFGVMRSWSDG